jgi:hypothetical protein
MYALLALVSLLIAAGSFYYFQMKDGGGTLFLIIGIVFGILFLVFGVFFMSSRVNKTEDIHITE